LGWINSDDVDKALGKNKGGFENLDKEGKTLATLIDEHRIGFYPTFDDAVARRNQMPDVLQVHHSGNICLEYTEHLGKHS
jgi:hypothetical protein